MNTKKKIKNVIFDTYFVSWANSNSNNLFASSKVFISCFICFSRPFKLSASNAWVFNSFCNNSLLFDSCSNCRVRFLTYEWEKWLGSYNLFKFIRHYLKEYESNLKYIIMSYMPYTNKEYQYSIESPLFYVYYHKIHY